MAIQGSDISSSVQGMVISSLVGALAGLKDAYKIGVDKTPMAANVPVFQRMLALQKELQTMMIEVGKVRGL